MQRLYREVLGRDGDVNGLNDWTRLLLNGEATGAELVADFIGSPEYREKETENASFVEMLYQTMLNRSSDPEGKAHWCSQLDEGRSRYEILKGFIFSEEFGRLCEMRWRGLQRRRLAIARRVITGRNTTSGCMAMTHPLRGARFLSAGV